MDKNSVSDNLATFTKKAFGVSSSGCDSDTEHFREVTKKMLDLFAAKNANYGNSFRKYCVFFVGEWFCRRDKIDRITDAENEACSEFEYEKNIGVDEKVHRY